MVEDWKARLPTICEGYALRDIYNLDESGLFYRQLPDYSLSIKGGDCAGGKKAKQRLSLVYVASAEGEMMKLAVIGHAANPRCFKNKSKSSLPVYWMSNTKAWMTTKLFKQTLTRLNRKFAAEGRHILLFIDNAPSHPKDLANAFSNMKLVFLPASTTPFLQALDQGIIMDSKRKYRGYQLRYLISKMDEPGCDLTASELAKTITVYDAIKLIAKATKEVTPSCIKKCFAKVGVSAVALGRENQSSSTAASAESASSTESQPTPSTSSQPSSSTPTQPAASASAPEEDSDDEEDNIPLQVLAQLMQKATQKLGLQSAMSVKDFLETDSSIPTDEDFSTGWDEGSVQEEPTQEEDDEEEDPAEEPEDSTVPALKPPTVSEAIHFLRRLENLCMSKDKVKPSTLESIGNLMCDLEELQTQGALTKQSNIKSFFQSIPKEK